MSDKPRYMSLPIDPDTHKTVKQKALEKDMAANRYVEWVLKTAWALEDGDLNEKGFMEQMKNIKSFAVNDMEDARRKQRALKKKVKDGNYELGL